MEVFLTYFKVILESRELEVVASGQRNHVIFDRICRNNVWWKCCNSFWHRCYRY